METKCSMLNVLILRCLLENDKQLKLRRETGTSDKHFRSSVHKGYLSHRSKWACLQSECRSRGPDAWGPGTCQYYEVAMTRRRVHPRTLRRQHWDRRESSRVMSRNIGQESISNVSRAIMLLKTSTGNFTRVTGIKAWLEYGQERRRGKHAENSRP